MPSTLSPPRPSSEQSGVGSHNGADAKSAAEGAGTGTWTRTTVALMLGGLAAFAALLSLIIALFAIAKSSERRDGAIASAPSQTRAARATRGPQAHVRYESFKRVDPTLPSVPPGAVKVFRVGVTQHVVKVAPNLPPTEVWSYTVNGRSYPGTGASPPIVVNQGDRVRIEFTNGGNRGMRVTMPHSIDFHSAEVAPSRHYVDVAPGQTKVIAFTARHPGVFMYHCATQPVLWHVGNGMAGMMVVRPRGLAPVDRELWITQQEYYLGKPGAPGDLTKMSADKPSVVAFNGYAEQYKLAPITVRRGERIRMWVLNAGPNRWTAFHVIGTVFDRAVVENTTFRSSQTINLAPSQGGYVEFTLDEEGSYPFVDHSFADAARGAIGVLRTTHAPRTSGGHDGSSSDHGSGHGAAAAQPQGVASGTLAVELGEMYVRPASHTVKAGRVTFVVRNAGQAMHRFAVGRAPLQMKGAEPSPAAALARGRMLGSGATERVAVTLRPGRYVLWCLVPGHYLAGQRTTIEVVR